MHLHREPTSNDSTTAVSTQGSMPSHQAQLRSKLSLPHSTLGVEHHGIFCRAASHLRSGYRHYTRLDSSLTWQRGEGFSISLVGQNLLQDRHLEYAGPDSSVKWDLIKRSAHMRRSRGVSKDTSAMRRLQLTTIRIVVLRWIGLAIGLHPSDMTKTGLHRL